MDKELAIVMVLAPAMQVGLVPIVTRSFVLALVLLPQDLVHAITERVFAVQAFLVRIVRIRTALFNVCKDHVILLPGNVLVMPIILVKSVIVVSASWIAQWKAPMAATVMETVSADLASENLVVNAKFVPLCANMVVLAIAMVLVLVLQALVVINVKTSCVPENVKTENATLLRESAIAFQAGVFVIKRVTVLLLLVSMVVLDQTRVFVPATNATANLDGQESIAAAPLLIVSQRMAAVVMGSVYVIFANAKLATREWTVLN